MKLPSRLKASRSAFCSITSSSSVHFMKGACFAQLQCEVS
jgi:hypothetical protein